MSDHNASFEADPASHEPSRARQENCVPGGRVREEDPDERNIRLLNRMIDLGMERLERNDAEDREEARARRRIAYRTDKILTPEQRAARDAGDERFQELTKTIRLCMALADKFRTARREREKQEAAGEQQRNARCKDHLARLVTTAIRQASAAEAETTPGNAPKSRDDLARTAFERTSWLTERLTEYDIDRDVGKLPFSELAVRLCREMGIGMPWEISEDGEWLREDARPKTPDSAEAPEAALSIGSEPVARFPGPRGMLPETGGEQRVLALPHYYRRE
jgi:hypothetical protein